MKQFSATEARKQFFRILDSAVGGEKVLIERNGVLVQLVPNRKKKTQKAPDYTSLIHSDVKEADRWTWNWHPARGLTSKKRKK